MSILPTYQMEKVILTNIDGLVAEDGPQCESAPTVPLSHKL